MGRETVGDPNYDPAYNPQTAEYKRRMALESKNKANDLVMNAYNPPPEVMSQNLTNAINYNQNIPTGYTPEQELAMRNRIRSTDTAQNIGAINKMREYMASQGLGGSGYEGSTLGGLIRGQNAARQGALSNLDISNAQLANQNEYQKAGMLNQLTGMGEQGNQYNLGQYNNMYQYGTTFDEQKRQADQQRNDYQKQLDEWKKQIGWGTTPGGYNGNVQLRGR